RSLRDSGAIDAVGDALSRIWTDIQQAIGLLEPIFENLMDSLTEVGDAVGTTLVVGFRLAWQAADAFLDVTETLLDVLGPVADLIGGNLTPIIYLLGLRLLFAQRGLVATTLGFTAVSRVAGQAQTAVTNFTTRMSERLLTAGGQVGAFAGQVAREMPRA